MEHFPYFELSNFFEHALTFPMVNLLRVIQFMIVQILLNVESAKFMQIKYLLGVNILH